MCASPQAIHRTEAMRPSRRPGREAPRPAPEPFPCDLAGSVASRLVRFGLGRFEEAELERDAGLPRRPRRAEVEREERQAAENRGGEPALDQHGNPTATGRRARPHTPVVPPLARARTAANSPVNARVGAMPARSASRRRGEPEAEQPDGETRDVRDHGRPVDGEPRALDGVAKPGWWSVLPNGVRDETAAVKERARDAIAEPDDGVRVVVERDDEEAAGPEDTRELDESAIDLGEAGEVVERRVRDDDVDGSVVERQLLHVGDRRLETRMPDTGRLHDDRGGDVDAHHALGAREEQPHQPVGRRLVEEGLSSGPVPIRCGSQRSRSAPLTASE